MISEGPRERAGTGLRDRHSFRSHVRLEPVGYMSNIEHAKMRGTGLTTEMNSVLTFASVASFLITPDRFPYSFEASVSDWVVVEKF